MTRLMKTTLSFRSCSSQLRLSSGTFRRAICPGSVLSTDIVTRQYSSHDLQGSNKSIAIENKDVIFSGIQPTGTPHLGNYLGALKQWVHLQDTAHSGTTLLFSIVDMHAITMPQDSIMLKKRRTETLISLLAIGLDPERSIIFYQSDVHEHAELMWILSCVAPMNLLERQTQYKLIWKRSILIRHILTAKRTSKVKIKSKDTTSKNEPTGKNQLKLGLFSYPVLQAADILLYRGTLVPVGEDQTQHLELARDLASKMNRAFDHAELNSTTSDKLFPLPTTLLTPAKRIMSLKDPLVKMSKSDPSPMSRIDLMDAPDLIKQKIRKALTDSLDEQGITWDPKNRPGLANLIEILGHIGGREDYATIAEEHQGNQFQVFKEHVGTEIVNALEPIRVKYTDILDKSSEGYIEEVRMTGARKASELAKETLNLVKARIGLS